MTKIVAKVTTRQKKFIPNMENFKISLSYEGLSLRKSSEDETIADLKRKYTYAR